MRIAPMIVAFWIFTISVMLFNGTLGDSHDLDPYENLDDAEGNAVWKLMSNPVGFLQNDLTISFILFLTLAGGISLALGTIMKSDMVLLFTMFTAWFGLITIPTITIYSFFNDNLGQIMCSATTLAAETTGCASSIFVTAILAGVPTLFYVFACVEWWTSRPLTR